ncbi:FG-GAP-like repeat-containing protein [Marivirga arenosa]|uniref:FG-GAP-like repeat-containing protein n=1 Tax=Marivirga arenosa TaxID=3059076 RepID=A0AA51N7M5_9BACT|nr:FG-GAP-like repeat-containing protein [Marivirga sp. ABR2-2]WMN06015.1 FG-GAP-like repeat-containing protein [Marivirga sp. ABR2-2]
MRSILLIVFILLFTSEKIFSQSFREREDFGIPALGNVQSEWLDYNQDGLPDMLINGTDENGNQVFGIYKNDGLDFRGVPQFLTLSLPVSSLSKAAFQLIDINNDNATDIVYTGENSSGIAETTVLLGDGTGFSNSGQFNLPAIHSAKLAEIDFDQNGFSDLLIMGLNTSGEIETSLWLNNGNDFTKSDINLPQVYGGSWAVLDIDDDQYRDIIISGKKSDGIFTTRILLNNSGKSVSNQANSIFDDYLIQEIKTADLNSDGKEDLVISGKSGTESNSTPFAQIFENASGNFTKNEYEPPALTLATIELIDSDNDGDLDILLFGFDTDYTRLYFIENESDFRSADPISLGMLNGAAVVADFNQNGKQDVFYSGLSDSGSGNASPSSRMLVNDISVTNAAPSIPKDLVSFSKDDSVKLSWSFSADDRTASSSISYNLSIGSNADGSEFGSPEAILSNGQLLRMKDFNLLQNEFKVNQLPEGEYFWSVQAIDASGNTSNFSTEENFTICHIPDLGADTALCKGEEITFTAGSATDQVKWYFQRDGLELSDQNTFTLEVLSTDKLIVEIVKPLPLGCTVYDTVAIEMLELPLSPLDENAEVCEGEDLSYELAMPNHTINWYSANQGLLFQNTSAIDFKVIENDTLIAEIINENNCSILDSVIIKKLDLPEAVPLVDTVICMGEELEWNITGSFNAVNWKDASGNIVAKDVNTYTAVYDSPDTLFIEKLNANLCTAIDTVAIHLNPLPTVDLGPDLEICDQSSTIIELPGDWSYIQWTSKNKGVLNESSNTLNWEVAENDKIYVEAADSYGCVNYDTLSIVKIDLPEFNIGNDTTLFKGSNILLSTPADFASVNWYSKLDGPIETGSQSLDYRVLKSDTIIAEAFNDKGCVYFDTISIAQSFNEQTTFGIPALGNVQSEWLDYNQDGLPDLLINGAAKNGNQIFNMYRNNGNQSFSAVGLPINGLEKSAFQLIDINNDNTTDIIYTGKNASSAPETLILVGDGAGFTLSNQYSLPELYSAQLSVIDFDQNGFSDLLIMGLDANDGIETGLWLNDGNDFYKSDIAFPQLYRGSWGVLDINDDHYRDIIISGEKADGFFTSKIFLNNAGHSISNQANSVFNDYLIQEFKTADLTADGKQDLIISGRDNSFVPFTKIFENASGQFTEIPNVLSTLTSATIEVIDADNDGDLDISLFGLDNNSNFQGYLYLKEGGTYSENSAVLQGISNGDAAVADFDKNGSQDIFYAGFSDIDPASSVICRILFNQNETMNAAPSIPDGLASFSKDDSVRVSWNKSADDLTTNSSISYNLRIGSTNSAVDFGSPLANLVNGKLYKSQDFYLLQNEFKINELAEGEYFWSVQSVDASGNSSVFSTEESFVICKEPDLGADTAVCKYEELLFSAGSIGDEVNWYLLQEGTSILNQNDFQWEITASDTLVVEVIKQLGCTVTDTIAVEMLELPESPLPEEEFVCEGEILIYNLEMPDHKINWYSFNDGLLEENSNYLEWEVNYSDTLLVEFINAANCIIQDSVFIRKLELPNAVALIDTTICKGEELEWKVEGSFSSIEWVSLNKGVVANGVNTYTDVYNERDTLFISKTNTSGCSIIDTVVVNINPLPLVELGPDLQVCDQSTATIELAGEWSSIQWSSAAEGVLEETTASLTWEVTRDDVIYVEAADLNGCINFDTLAISKLALPDFTIGNDTTICKGGNILLNTGTGFAATNWYSKADGLIEKGSRFLEYDVLKTDTIIAEVFGVNGCVEYDSIAIVANEPFQYSLGEDVEYCQGELVNIIVDNLQDSINWYLNDSLTNTHTKSISFVADSSLAVSIQTFDSLQCVTFDTIQVRVNPLPLVDLPEKIIVCEGDSVFISNSEKYEFMEWESVKNGTLANDTTSISFVAKETDTFILSVGDINQCFIKDTVIVEVNDLPEFSLGEDQAICTGDSISLSIDKPADSINWFNDLGQQLLDTSSTITFQVTQDQNWWAEQWNSNGCVYTDSIQISAISLPEFDAGDSILICKNEVASLNPSGLDDNWKLSWSPSKFVSNDSIANPEVMPTEDTWFYLEVENSNGCLYTDSVFVAIDKPLMLDAGDDRVICLGDETILGGNPTASGSQFNYQYEWSPAESLNDPDSANPIAKPKKSTTYQLISWAGNCKADTAEVTVRVQTPPEIILTADTTIGAGDAIQLQASGGQFYQWLPERGLSDATIANPIANPVRTTTYTVEVLDSVGCISSREMTIYVENQLFIPNLFTPNADGQNDFFKVYGAGIKEIEFRVFTRGGKLLYRTTSVEEAYSVGWDGKYQGNLVESGVYVWSIKGKYFDDRPISYNGQQSGLINLMR